MRFKFDWILNHWSLLVVNILIIIAIEASGFFFLRTGIVHLIAVIFVVLGLLRLRYLPNVHDQYLQPVVRRGIVALIVLATSHIVEYSSYRFGLPVHAVHANVVNFYLAGLLFITLGTEVFHKEFQKIFQKRSQKESVIIAQTSRIAIFIFLFLVILFSYNPGLVRFKSTSESSPLWISLPASSSR